MLSTSPSVIVRAIASARPALLVVVAAAAIDAAACSSSVRVAACAPLDCGPHVSRISGGENVG